MDPEPVGGAATCEVGEGVLGGGARACFADRSQIEREESVGERLATVAGLFLRVAEADDNRCSGQTSGDLPSRSPTAGGPWPVTNARSIDAASPEGSADGW